ncbi:MAG: DUF6893 family small protein [Acidimicrobiales bacterium]
MKRFFTLVLFLGTVGGAAYKSAPDLARYLKIRSM